MNTNEFYPSESNGAFAPPIPLSESGYSQESRATGPDCDADNENTQENTEYDPSCEGTVEDCKMPSYKAIVLAKKRELKDQYGKGYFLKPLECGGKPARNNALKYSPILRITWPKKFDNQNAYDAADHRFADDMAQWHECQKGANAIGWVSGWRSKWKEFKNNSGLDMLKAQAKCETPGGSPLNPTYTPTPMTNPASAMIAGMSCQQLKDAFAIIPNQSWGTAPTEVIKEWQNRQCFVVQPNTTSNASHSNASGASNAPSGILDKIISNMATSAIIGAIVLVILITAIILWPTKKTANA